MITNVPANWKYNESLEMLFLFYQRAEELLSVKTIDTYRLPAHNTMTLCIEIRSLFSALKSRNQLEEYYQKYICPVIDELIASIHEDALLKGKLSDRLDTILTGLDEAKKNSKQIIRWLDLIFQLCTPTQYYLMYKEEIVRLIMKGKNKNNLLFCEQVYFVCLKSILGYSMEYMYTTTMRFFANEEIKDLAIIRKYLDIFSGKENRIDLFIVADCYLRDLYEPALSFFESNYAFEGMQEVNEKEIAKIANYHSAVDAFYREYQNQRFNRGRTSVQMLKVTICCLDPYCARDIVNDAFYLLHCFEGYFKHKENAKVIFDCVCRDENGRYFPIKKSRVLSIRPYVDEETILSRVKLIWNEKHMSRSAFSSIIHALTLHDEAVSAKDENVILRTFWTATETLFAMPEFSVDRDNVIYSLMYIIQKTYILKLLRYIYNEIVSCIGIKVLNSEFGITDFSSFLDYFSNYAADAPEMKTLYSKFGNNLLLRTRVYTLRKQLDDGKKILEMLQKHERKILWQLQRIYRARNLSTHAGITVDNVTYLINNLHNYFDYALNFMICKCENGDYVASVGTVVFEAKTDYRIYLELLKKGDKLAGSNNRDLLFGPDKRLISYNFEFAVDTRIGKE